MTFESLLRIPARPRRLSALDLLLSAGCIGFTCRRPANRLAMRQSVHLCSPPRISEPRSSTFRLCSLRSLYLVYMHRSPFCRSKLQSDTGSTYSRAFRCTGNDWIVDYRHRKYRHFCSIYFVNGNWSWIFKIQLVGFSGVPLFSNEPFVLYFIFVLISNCYNYMKVPLNDRKRNILGPNCILMYLPLYVFISVVWL